jgi:hypothetical protein
MPDSWAIPSLLVVARDWAWCERVVAENSGVAISGGRALGVVAPAACFDVVARVSAIATRHFRITCTLAPLAGDNVGYLPALSDPAC